MSYSSSRPSTSAYGRALTLLLTLSLSFLVVLPVHAQGPIEPPIRLLKDINQSKRGFANPSDFAVVGNVLYFAQHVGPFGREL